MSDQELPLKSTPNPVLTAAEDVEISDEELGRLVRMYRGTLRPPETVVVRPSGWEKALVLLMLAAAGIFIVTFAYTLQDRTNKTNEVKEQIKTELYVTCDMMGQLHLDVPNECPPEATR